MAADLSQTFAFAFVQLLVAPVLTALLARAFSVEEFGRFNLWLRVSLILTPIFTLGVAVGVTRFVAHFRQKGFGAAFFWAAICIAIIGSVIAGLAAEAGLLNWLFKDIGGIEDWWIVPAVVALPGISRILTAWLRGSGNIAASNAAALGWTIARVLVASLMVTVGALDAVSVVVLFLAIDIGIHLIVMIGVSWPAFPQMSEIRRAANQLIRYSAPRSPGGLALQVIQSIGVIYFSSRGDLTSAAYISAGLAVLNFGSVLFSRLGSVLLPHFSHSLAAEDIDGEIARKVAGQLAVIISFLLAAGVILGSLGYLVTPLVIPFWLGREYDAAQSTVTILTSITGAMAIYSVVSGALNAKDTRPINTINLSIVLVFMSILVLIGPSFEAEEIAWIQFAGFVLLAGLTIWWALRLFEVSRSAIDLGFTTILAALNLSLVLVFQSLSYAGIIVNFLMVIVLVAADVALVILLRPSWYSLLYVRLSRLRTRGNPSRS